MVVPLQKQLGSITDEIRAKEGQIGEERKKLRELDTLYVPFPGNCFSVCTAEPSHRLKDYGEAYEVVKSERNKIHSQIQLSTQVGKFMHPSSPVPSALTTPLYHNRSQLGAELREKIRILQGEMAILQSTTENKEK